MWFSTSSEAVESIADRYLAPISAVHVLVWSPSEESLHPVVGLSHGGVQVAVLARLTEMKVTPRDCSMRSHVAPLRVEEA